MVMAIHPVPGKRKSLDICEAFAEGYARGGGDANNQHASVFYGVVDTNYFAWKRVRQTGRDFYYIDNSYFDKTRETHFRVTKNAVQLTRSMPSTGERWAALGYDVKPWRETGYGKVLIVPQSDVFMSCVAEYPGPHGAWLRDALALAERTWPGRKVVVRNWSPNKVALSKTLHEDLADTGMLITHSSAAAIEATIVGIQVSVSPMSAVSGMICSNDPDADGRSACYKTLADNQWTLEEIRRGDAWQKLNR